MTRCDRRSAEHETQISAVSQTARVLYTMLLLLPGSTSFPFLKRCSPLLNLTFNEGRPQLVTSSYLTAKTHAHTARKCDGYNYLSASTRQPRRGAISSLRTFTFCFFESHTLMGDILSGRVPHES